MQKKQVALVAGGGIGGLTAALSLAKRGFDVQIFEQADGTVDTGAGIQLSPNCTRVLHDLGLADALAPWVCYPEQIEVSHWRSGRVIMASPLGEDVRRRTGFPYYHIHRSDLMAVLLRAVEETAGIELKTGLGIDGFVQQDNAVTLQSDTQQYKGDLLIGADGIHSTVRSALFSDSPARFTGNVAWRATVPARRLPEDLLKPAASVWWGPGKHFVHYFIRAAELVNCVCVVKQSGWQGESWTEPGDHNELKQAFAGWHPTIQLLIDSMDPQTCYRWALFDRNPMSSWGRTRVTLLGDACHPTLPFLAQGAAMAIEDAAVLSQCLGSGATIEQALKRYETLRKPRTRRVQLASRRNGSAYHLSGMFAGVRNIVAAHLLPRTTNWLYDYDPLRIN